eukprot:c2646_g1_i2.p1 GENE.c2646_g1_i2~~c2646_g1_i2.p1  ORF type:complete len:210 (+),score=27.07 c2646_g1_i2:195-824(+)
MSLRERVDGDLVPVNDPNALFQLWDQQTSHLKCLSNPAAFNRMCDLHNINSHVSLHFISSIPDQEDYQHLRATQNRNFSALRVKQGIEFARNNQVEQAMKCYQSALEVDNSNHDAYVARGAAYANMRRFEAAVGEFRKALAISPTDKNAKKFLETVVEQMKIEKDAGGKDGDWKEKLIAKSVRRKQERDSTHETSDKKQEKMKKRKSNP